jgi:hypothetical protein
MLAVVAFVAMCANDILGTCMVIFEARAGAGASVAVDSMLAGVFDVGGWIAGLICAALAIDEIIRNGWRTRKSLTIIGAVSAANFAGTILGVWIALSLPAHH